MSRHDSGHVRNDWTINISLDDHDGQARATALFRGRDKESVGVGVSRLKTDDRFVASIGDELAVARALSDLARQMMAAAAQDIETVTTRRDHVVAAKPD
jgi:Rv2632c-like